MRRIVTSLSPNTEKDDIWLAAGLLFQPWHWQTGHAIADLEHAMSAFFQSEAISFESGRSALTAIIQALEIPAESEIILQAFTCAAVPNSVRWAECTPVYADVDPETFTIDVSTLEHLTTYRTRAIILQHTFGIPANIETIMNWARQHNVFVIEDCAHSFGSRWKGQLLGTFGDAAVFSFGRDKALSSVFGGIVITRHTAVTTRVRKIQRQMPLADRSWIAQQLAHPFILAISLAFYDTLGLGKLFLELAKRLRIISKAVAPEERKGNRPKWTGRKMPNALAHLALHQWKKRERFDAHRRHIVEIYNRDLDLDWVTLPQWSTNADPVLLRYPIRIEKRKELFHMARKKHIQLGDWYTSPLAPEDVDETGLSYDRTTTPSAVALTHTIVNLPTHIHISEEDAHRIVKMINAL